MTPVRIDTAELRTDAARDLIRRAREHGAVKLTKLTAVELCTLGGPGHAWFDELTARAWLRLGDRGRERAIASATAELLARGLLLQDTTEAAQAATYAMSPLLGIVLAARSRPSFVIANSVTGANLFQPVLFALGDETEPLQGIVVETPAGMTEKSRRDPLAGAYAYALLSPEESARFLAEWVIKPVRGIRGVVDGTPRQVTRYKPQDSAGGIGYQLSIESDGTIARVEDGTGSSAQDYGLDGLRVLMGDLIGGRLG
jgi:hypothetical protein